jgi:hypothetical protein
VIKEVRGNLYEYLQESYRLGDQVRTKSKYLGRVDKKKKPKTEPNPEKKLLDCTVDLQQYKISRSSLEAVLKKSIEIHQNIGIDTADFAKKIKIRYGKTGFSKSPLGHYTVSIRKYSSGNRSKFQNAFRAALSLVGLDFIKIQNPKLFSTLQYGFDKSFKNTQNALTTYIMNTSDYAKIYKMLALKWYGIFYPTYKNPLKTDALGLTNIIRKNWIDEYSGLFSEIMHKGYSKTLKHWKNEYFRALHNEKNAMQEYLQKKKKTNVVLRLAGWTKDARKNINRAISRRISQKEMQNKISLLNEIFQFHG